ncbi:MAG TPA: aminotransferase class V-fold PLP-dependent enzyme [Flavilitoribacter sp.]|nr:aminotransferase class V-fold PLP-dependent enzyme [Flavilitoribacter sp.]HMQ90452.1 aminotransferase class V-fold PLP-dependent enzyme [Flavilitoribacter sp.]
MDLTSATLDTDLTLDPKDWTDLRALGHRMLDDMMDYLENIREEPVWRPIPGAVKAFFDKEIPQHPENIEEIYDEFKRYILPYNKGNVHPRFFAFVQGTGTPFGVLAEMLAAALNPNVGIGEHASMYVDKQVVEWCKQMMNFPAEASGILLSGGSMANITALAVARNHQLGLDVRKSGLKAVDGQMTLYYSAETHSCMRKAAEVLGLGLEGVRQIPVDADYRINLEALEAAIQEDLAAGHLPFCIVGNAGTVNTGAIDPLDELRDIADRYKLWLHVDGAFGALAKLTPAYREPLKAIERADSVAFDLHKWMYMPYEVGVALVKYPQAHRDAFAVTPAYLSQEKRGLAGGPDPMNNFGMELSRGFKALKVWMSLKEHGLEKYARMIGQNIDQACYLGQLVDADPELELLAPVTMNIVCYRYVKPGLSEVELNELNREILIRLQEEGIASPSSTVLQGRFAIRVANVNQRSVKADFEVLARETVRIGREVGA